MVSLRVDTRTEGRRGRSTRAADPIGGVRLRVLRLAGTTSGMECHARRRRFQDVDGPDARARLGVTCRVRTSGRPGAACRARTARSLKCPRYIDRVTPRTANLYNPRTLESLNLLHSQIFFLQDTATTE